MLRLLQPPFPPLLEPPAGLMAPQDVAATPLLCVSPARCPRSARSRRLWSLGRPAAGRAEGTFAAPHGDLGEGVVAAVALPPYDAGFAGTLPCLHVAGPRVGAGGEAVAGVAGVTALGPVVVGLGKPK